MKITVETLVPAPLPQVWRACTTAADILHWNAASDDCHATRATVDLRPGGMFSSRMEAGDGSFGFDLAGTCTNVVPPEQIGYVFGDRDGREEFRAGERCVTIRVAFDAETEDPAGGNSGAGKPF